SSSRHRNLARRGEQRPRLLHELRDHRLVRALANRLDVDPERLHAELTDVVRDQRAEGVASGLDHLSKDDLVGHAVAIGLRSPPREPFLVRDLVDEDEELVTQLAAAQQILQELAGARTRLPGRRANTAKAAKDTHEVFS